jgi:hypothetical protein
VQGALAEAGFPAPRPVAHGPGRPGLLEPFLSNGANPWTSVVRVAASARSRLDRAWRRGPGRPRLSPRISDSSSVFQTSDKSTSSV